MINFHNQVPTVYSSASRDFQYIGWLINIVLNAVKHNIDDIYNLPNTHSDAKLTELLAMTLGFKVKRNYDKKQLTALAAILPSILRYKGTEKAIRMAAEALVMASGSLGDASVNVDGTEIIVTLPKDLVDTTLFSDLLNYILPAGMTCRIIRKNETKKTVADIEVKSKDQLLSLVVDDLAWLSTENGISSTGLSTMYTPDNYTDTPDFTANIKLVDGNSVINSGLLDNTIIPVLANSRVITGETPRSYVTLYSTEGIDEDGAPIIEPLVSSGNVQLKAKKAAQEL